jgi:hypothetical protein
MEYYDQSIIESLSDLNLMEYFKKSKSTKKILLDLKSIIEVYIDKEKIELLINELLPFVIKAGTKGVIRGLKFNDIVGNYLKLHFTNVKIEHKLKELIERPDWYVKHNDKIVVGYNQIDLWSGGAQLNRGNKYVCDNNFHKHENIKIIAVIANKPKRISPTIKKILDIGFKEKRLSYVNGLESIIKDYLELSSDEVHPSKCY